MAAPGLGVTLLGDLRDVFAAKNTDRLESKQTVDELVSMEERPWPEMARGNPMSPTQLARKLKPFGIKPEKWRALGVGHPCNNAGEGIVERTFGWLTKHRRLSKDYERTTAASEALIRVAMIGNMARRLAQPA